jgi:hypothetical protein
LSLSPQSHLIFGHQEKVPTRKPPEHEGEHEDYYGRANEESQPGCQFLLLGAVLAGKAMHDGVGDERRVVDASYRPVSEEEDEKLRVGGPNAVLDPWAVVVHAHHAFVALLAVH